MSVTDQMPVVGVVRVGDEDVSHVVQVPVVGAVGADDGGLHHVAEHVDAALLVQRDLPPVGLRGGNTRYGGNNTSGVLFT